MIPEEKVLLPWEIRKEDQATKDTIMRIAHALTVCRQVSKPPIEPFDHFDYCMPLFVNK